MQQLQMSIYLKTEISEINSQLNKIRNFIKNNSITSEKRHHAITELQTCLFRLYSQREGNMNDAQMAYKAWEVSENKSIREVAESRGGHEVYSDDLHYVVEMPDGSCVVDTACSEYTTTNIDKFHERLDEEEKCSE